MDNARDGGTDMVGPLVNQEEKSSVTIDNDSVEGGDNKIKGDSSCVLPKGGTWCTTHDCQARMVSSNAKKWRYRPGRKDYGYFS